VDLELIPWERIRRICQSMCSTIGLGIIYPPVDYNQRMWGRLLRLFAVALLLGACGGRVQTPPAETTPHTDDLAARSQAALDGAVKADAPGCSAAVGIEGKVIWTGVRGVADLATGAKIGTDTVFDIASVSKQFTATAALLLADAGRLSLDDALSSHVPGLPAWAGTVTVAQLMHQTSGIPDYVNLLQDQGYQYSDRTTQADALRALATAAKLEFEPGARFEYSNSNYLLLGEVVGQVAGVPLPRYLDEQMFKPLDLAMAMDPGSRVPHKAVSYEKDDGPYAVSESAWEEIGDGSVQTTPSQLVRWADNYRTGRVGGQKLLDAQFAGAVETDSGDARYGAGMFLFPDGTLDHDGAWAGFVTAFRVDRDRRQSVAVSCNAGDQDPESIADDLMAIWM
jgi:CubicO group peptidase (beta-lactamase class C family)